MIYPTILCGGSGTRLWPLSRKGYPKQFAQLLGDETLLQATARRLSGPQFAPPLIVTNSDFRFIATQQLAQIGMAPSAVLIEPQARNTAPAVLAAALYALQSNADALLLVAPSDHAMPDTDAFHAAVARGVGAAQAGQIVTFGAAPLRAETGYGYVQLATALDARSAAGAPVPVIRFVEKPNAARAAQMLAAGCYLWNAGIFLFRAADMLAAFAAYAPDVLAPVRAALAAAQPDLGFLRLDAAHWATAPDISIDYAVMEHAPNIVAVPLAQDWSDLGGWDSVHAQSQPDARNVALSGAALAIECDNSLLRADSEGVALVGLGLKNIIAIAMSDAVLVADMSRAQDVKQAVAALRARAIPQADQLPRDHRPWGWFESLALGDGFQVKRIHVHPKACLSLQSHSQRAEHWIVVQGTAEVTLGDTVQLVGENQSVYIPVGQKHRLANPGAAALVLIEVQTGRYLGEDDITRYQDAYARN